MASKKVSEYLHIDITRSDNVTVSAGQNEIWGVTALSGLGAAEVELFTEDKGFGNGSIVTGKRAADRQIELSCKARPGYVSVPTSRQRIVGFFSSDYTYKFTVNLYDTVRTTPVDCYLVSADIPTENNLRSRLAEWSVTLDCPEPYLAGTDASTTPLSDVIPKWGFPVMHWKNTTLYTTGYYLNQGRERNIYYNGTAPTYVIFDFIITKDIGGFTITLDRADGGHYEFTITRSFMAGDTVYIDVRNSIVQCNGSAIDVDDYVDTVAALSELMLTAGYNQFSILDDSGENTIDGNIYYTAEYNGV